MAGTRSGSPPDDSNRLAVSPRAVDMFADRDRLRDLLDHVPAGIVIHEPDGTVDAANGPASTLLQRTWAQLFRAPASDAFWKFVRPDGSPMPAEEYPVNQVMARCAPVADVVVGVPVADGVRWMLCNAYPVFHEDHRIRHVVVCFTDCTELVDAEHSLRASEERLRLVLQGTTDAAWDLDLRTGRAYLSERWWAMLGEVDQAEDATIDTMWGRMPPAERERVQEALAGFLATRHTGFQIEYSMIHHDGHLIPVLARGYALRDAEGSALRLSGTNTDLTKQKETERRIYELAFLDHLTALPNRRLLVERLELALDRASRTGAAGALLVIDLDNFKLLNESLGHETGDALLREVAARLKHAVRSSDQLARLGGDEFVVLLEDLGRDQETAALEANVVAHQVIDALSRPFDLAGRSIYTSPSIGIATFARGDGSVDEVLRQADMAMYQAKREGRNTSRFFSDQLQRTVARRGGLEHDLREALANHELVLYCQPQVDLHGRVLGGELLLRWHNQQRGWVEPSDFIPLAESLGLIRPIGRDVLWQGCELLARWAHDPRLAEMSLAVNVSVQQQREPEFVQEVRDALVGTGANPERLVLELTETVFAEDLRDTVAKMWAVRELGVRFALDDFGTGYSSLSYLTRLPIDLLKIDRSFVHAAPDDPTAAVIVDAITAMANKLGLELLAEGVETEEQKALLAASGCRKFQGFLFDTALPVDQFAARYGM